MLTTFVPTTYLFQAETTDGSPTHELVATHQIEWEALQITIGEYHGLPEGCSMTIHYEFPYLTDEPKNANVFSDDQEHFYWRQ